MEGYDSTHTRQHARAMPVDVNIRGELDALREENERLLTQGIRREGIGGELDTLRQENARLLTQIEGLKVALRPRPRKAAATVGGRTKREEVLIAEGKAPFKGAIWFGHGHGWGIKRRRATVAGSFPVGAAVRGGEVSGYLAATGKSTVPAHDPAFGRR